MGKIVWKKYFKKWGCPVFFQYNISIPPTSCTTVALSKWSYGLPADSSSFLSLRIVQSKLFFFRIDNDNCTNLLQNKSFKTLADEPPIHSFRVFQSSWSTIIQAQTTKIDFLTSKYVCKSEKSESWSRNQ